MKNKKRLFLLGPGKFKNHQPVGRSKACFGIKRNEVMYDAADERERRIPYTNRKVMNADSAPLFLSNRLPETLSHC